MAALQWLRWLQSRTRSARTKVWRRPWLYRQPALEALEDRILMSVTPEVEPNNLLTQATAIVLTSDPVGGKFFTGLGTGDITPGSDIDY